MVIYVCYDNMFYTLHYITDLFHICMIQWNVIKGWRMKDVKGSYNYGCLKVHVLIILMLTLKHEPRIFIHTVHTVDQLVSKGVSDHISEFFNMFGDLREVEKILHPALNQKTFSPFLGAFAKLRKAISSFIMSVRPSVCPHEKTRLPLDGFSWNLIFEYFRKTIEKIHV